MNMKAATLGGILLATTAACAAGFVNGDSRMPGAAARNFKMPFKAMFIGAHPDDADFQCGATALKLTKAGAKVMFVSVCSGNKGHQTMTSEALAARRYKETQASAKVLGIEKYVVLGVPDCEAEATLELRARLTAMIREFAPNVVFTHRTCDYHADHRAVGLAVQDSTYVMGVPLYCPDSPVPEILPFVMYGGDRFTVPRPFRADLACGCDDVLDTLLEAWACHESQEFEWLPPEWGVDLKDIPPASDHAGRIEFLRQHIPGRPRTNGQIHRETLDRVYGGKGPRYAEVFELCDYARKPCAQEAEFLEKAGLRWVNDCTR